jgi:hypothetical protein
VIGCDHVVIGCDQVWVHMLIDFLDHNIGHTINSSQYDSNVSNKVNLAIRAPASPWVCHSWSPNYLVLATSTTYFLPLADSKAVCRRPWNNFLNPPTYTKPLQTNNNACFLLVRNFADFLFRGRIVAAYRLGDSAHCVHRGREPPQRRCQGPRPLVARSVKCKTSATCATASGVSPGEIHPPR